MEKNKKTKILQLFKSSLLYYIITLFLHYPINNLLELLWLSATHAQNVNVNASRRLAIYQANLWQIYYHSYTLFIHYSRGANHQQQATQPDSTRGRILISSLPRYHISYTLIPYTACAISLHKVSAFIGHFIVCMR